MYSLTPTTGHCHLLHDHKCRVFGEQNDIYTYWGASPQDVRHLFACNAHPTDLTPEDLWRNPVVFMSSATSTTGPKMTTDTTQEHRPSSRSERNLIILQVNIDGIKNKLEELKLLIHNTCADIISIQETKLTPNANTPKVHNFNTVRADMLHKAGGAVITLIRDNITFTTTNIPSTINTHNT